jgi:hypothetical protein
MMLRYLIYAASRVPGTHEAGEKRHEPSIRVQVIDDAGTCDLSAPVHRRADEAGHSIRLRQRCRSEEDEGSACTGAVQLSRAADVARCVPVLQVR